MLRPLLRRLGQNENSKLTIQLLPNSFHHLTVSLISEQGQDLLFSCYVLEPIQKDLRFTTSCDPLQKKHWCLVFINSLDGLGLLVGYLMSARSCEPRFVLFWAGFPE